MTGTQRRSTIAGWLRKGYEYRTWTAKEITWVLYQEYTQSLYDAGMFKDLRTFLDAAGDKEALGMLDRERMGQTGGVDVADTPQLRGHGNG